MSKNGVAETIKTNVSETVKELQNFNKELDKSGDKTKDLVNQGKKLQKKFANAGKEASNMANDLSKALKFVNLTSITSIFKSLYKMFDKLSQSSVDYVEDLNLLKVAFGETADSALNMTKSIAEITGFDEAGMVRNLATFRNLTSTLGMANEQADLLAKNLEKMSLDISSLYNVNTGRAAYALQGMLTGQPRTIKTLTGANVTNASLQEELNTRGIGLKISELNKAEKAILQYITVEKQLANSNGDLARTIEQPAQLLRAFREQVSKAARSIGSLLIPVIQAVIPYLTAFLMVFNEIVAAITSFFGIDTNSFWESMVTGSTEVENNLDGIATAANKAKQGLRSFDKLNVIRTPSASASGSGAGNTLGINSKLLELLDEYNLKLEGVKTKATKIKERILETLGFHQELNEETGKWEWKYDGINTTIKSLWKEFKKLNPQTKIFVGLITTLIAAKTISALGKVLDVFKNSISPIKKLSEAFALMDNFSFKQIGLAVDAWRDSLSFIEKIGTALIGGGIVYLGLQMTRDGIGKIIDESNKLFGIIETGASGIASILGASLVGGAIGGATGGLIGGILGGIAFIITAIDEVDTKLNTNLNDIRTTNKEVNKLYEDWQQNIEDLQKAYDKTNVETDYYQRLWTELQGIVDENGKIKKGYEDRAETISTILAEALGIEIEVVDGNIKKWQDLNGEIDNYITKRKNAMKLSALEGAAKEALENLAGAQDKVTETYGNLQTAQGNYNSKLEQASALFGVSKEEIQALAKEIENGNISYTQAYFGLTQYSLGAESAIGWMKKEHKALVEAKEGYNTASKTLDGYRITIKNYETALGLSLSNNQEALDNFFDHEQYLYGKSDTEQQTYWENRKKLSEISLKQLEETRDKYSKKEYEDLKEQYQKDYDLAETEMEKLKLLMETKNGEINDEVVAKWEEMGTSSKEDFLESLSTLPDELKLELYDKMKQKGSELTEVMQEEFDKNGLTIDANIKAKEDKDNSTVYSNISTKIKNAINSATGIFNTISNFISGKGTTITAKAEGGFVNAGQLFVAREAGPEMVGRIGNSTAVANNDQIIEGISRGVANAIISTGGMNNRPVVIKAEGDANGLMSFIRFKQQEDDMQYGN